MTEPGNTFGDPTISAELEAIKAQLALMASETNAAKVTTDLAAIRDSLRRLSKDNEEVRLKLSAALGLRVDDAADD